MRSSTLKYVRFIIAASPSDPFLCLFLTCILMLPIRFIISFTSLRYWVKYLRFWEQSLVWPFLGLGLCSFSLQHQKSYHVKRLIFSQNILSCFLQIALALIFAKSRIYSSCQEAYRLTQTGNLDVLPEYVDPYCSGPCLSETHLVLNCIENITKNFVFYNKATIERMFETQSRQDVAMVPKEVFYQFMKLSSCFGFFHKVKFWCWCHPGNFDVSEHLQAEQNNAYNTANQILLGLGFMFAGPALLL